MSGTPPGRLVTSKSYDSAMMLDGLDDKYVTSFPGGDVDNVYENSDRDDDDDDDEASVMADRSSIGDPFTDRKKPLVMLRCF